MRHFWWQSSGGIDLAHAVPHPGPGRRSRPSIPRRNRHPALPDLNSRVGGAMVATMVIRVPLLTTYATVKHVDVSLPLVACCLTERNTLHVGEWDAAHQAAEAWCHNAYQ